MKIYFFFGIFLLLFYPYFILNRSLSTLGLSSWGPLNTFLYFFSRISSSNKPQYTYCYKEKTIDWKDRLLIGERRSTFSYFIYLSTDDGRERNMKWSKVEKKNISVVKEWIRKEKRSQKKIKFNLHVARDTNSLRRPHCKQKVLSCTFIKWDVLKKTIQI